MSTRPVTNPEIGLADAPAIPGLRFRPFDIDADLPALVDLIITANVADGEDYIPTVADLRNDLVHTADLEPSRDLVLAEIDGTLVGAATHSTRVRAGTLQHQLEGWVHPDHRRRGIGRALLHAGETRSRAAGEGRTEPQVFSSWISERMPGGIALLETEGYARVRSGFMMVRPLAEPIPYAPLPDGLEVRPVLEADHRRIWDADTEAFRDHWEAGERTDEDFDGWFSAPDLDTSMWRVAWDGDEVAGSVMNFVFDEENEKLGVRRGWLEHISVRRPWRKRGLAGALIAQSLRELQARGFDEAALGVDGENLSGALRLYESFGFRRHRMAIAFRKPL